MEHPAQGSSRQAGSAAFEDRASGRYLPISPGQLVARARPVRCVAVCGGRGLSGMALRAGRAFAAGQVGAACRFLALVVTSGPNSAFKPTAGVGPI
jgi:hypothetical protein